MAAKATTTPRQLANNRHAFHQYEVLEKFEAGIVLTGAEVKSTRAHEINLKSGYASIEKGEVILKNIHISPYKLANDPDFNPERYRRLLLNRKEIDHIEKQIHKNGLTLVPLSVYLKKGKIKVEIGLCKGKKQHDKRHDLKKKDQERQIAKHFRKH